MYFGEMPSATNWLSVGVRLRYRKSARKPSSEISIVVGAKREVPFEIAVAVNAATWLLEELESRYIIASRTRKKQTIDMYIQARRHCFDLFVCALC